MSGAAGALLDAADALADGFARVQQVLFEGAVQPLLYALGMANVLEEAYRATGWLLVGLVQLALIAVVFGALERWRPVEPVTDRQAVRVDIVYTLIHRLGLVRLALFFTLEPLWLALAGQLRLAGWPAFSVDQLWPGVTDRALVSFAIYLLLFDAVDYLIHRAQHRWDWWWQLHALHHSQRQMTRWSDNRNHLLDDVLRDAILVAVAFVVGVSPAQFVAVVAATQLLESLSHANLRLGFGPVFGRLLVSPQYHRRHHLMFGADAPDGPLAPARPGAGGGPGQPPRAATAAATASAPAGHASAVNLAVLFPLWDALGGTARQGPADGPTGLPDQLAGRDYGRGFWAQQALGMARLLRRGGR